MFVTKPNIPSTKVELAAVGEQYYEIISALTALGIDVIKVSLNNMLERYEQSHPDLRIHHLGREDIIIYRQDECLRSELEKHGFNIIYAQNDLQPRYPKTAALNALRIGDILLCNKRAVDAYLLKNALDRKLEIIYCNQGYSRCAACVVSENSVITSDLTVYNALKDKIDVLKISAGNIRLADTYDGMIGGASFLIDKSTLAFCGNIEAHPDFLKIKNFLLKHNVEYICLTKDTLVDIGTAVVLKSIK